MHGMLPSTPILDRQYSMQKQVNVGKRYSQNQT
jgi:hypothetical protein